MKLTTKRITPDIKGDKMKDIIKIILYADEDVYLKIYDQFSNFDEDLNREVHYFDRANSDVRHIMTNKYINFSINNTGGYRNVSHVIIQKSFYKNKDIIKILRTFKLINPNVKLLLFMNDDPSYYSMLMSIIANERLASIAFSIDDIEKWLVGGGELFDHSELIIKKITKKKRKEFLAY